MRSSSLLLVAALGITPVLAPTLPLAAQVQVRAAEPPDPSTAAGATEALDARLSPDGRRVAFRVAGARGAELRVVVVGEPAESAVAPGDRSVEPDSVYAWTPDGRGIVLRGAEDGHLQFLRVDEEGAAPRDLTPGIQGTARLAGFDVETGEALVELPGEWPEAPDLYRVDLSSGERTLVARNDGTVVRWMVDARGVPRVAVRGLAEGTEVVRVRGDTLTPIMGCEAGDVCEPLAFHPDGRIWVRSSRGAAAPALVLLDRISHEVEVVRADVSEDPHSAFRSDSVSAHIRALLDDRLPGTVREVHEPVADGGRMLVAARDSLGHTLHLLDQWSATVTRLVPLAGDPRVGVDAEPIPDPARLAPVELGYRESTNGEGAHPTDVRRTIERRTVEGREVWQVTERARVPTYDAIDFDPAALEDLDFEPVFELPPEPSGFVDAEDRVLLDGRTLRPLSRRLDGPLTIRLDFEGERIRGSLVSPGTMIPVDLALDEPVWSDGTALDLLVAALPLEDGYRASFRIFDAEEQAVSPVRLRVEDAPPARVEAGDFEVWRVTLSSVEGDRPEEVWLVRRGAPHWLVQSTVRIDDWERTIELVDAGGLR